MHKMISREYRLILNLYEYPSVDHDEFFDYITDNAPLDGWESCGEVLQLKYNTLEKLKRGEQYMKAIQSRINEFTFNYLRQKRLKEIL